MCMRRYLSIFIGLVLGLTAEAQEVTIDDYQRGVMRYYDYYEAHKPDSAEMVLSVSYWINSLIGRVTLCFMAIWLN